MARPGSVEVAGYFPTPDTVLPRIASVVAWPHGSSHGVLLDPCAGAGDAIRALRDAWSTEHSSRGWRPSGPAVLACELEAERAESLRKTLDHHRDRVFAGDAFCLSPTTDVSDAGGATVLYLNPPYDADPDHGRLEQRFLERFTAHLARRGILLYLVPYSSLTASAGYLARHYSDLRCWRLPPADFDRFRQVLVGGRRRPESLATAPHVEAQVSAWAREPERLPELPVACPAPFEIPAPDAAWYRLDYRLSEADLDSVVTTFEPWSDGQTGGRLSAYDLLGARFPVVLPPKPAHLALALAAGMFNGHRLDPDDPARFPALLAKGAYRRESVEIDSRESEDGTLSRTTIDRPHLTVTVLRLDTCEFHELPQGTEPAGGDDLARWTPADLLLHYGASMTALLRRQFPALHDPADPRHRLKLPDLPREPLRAQDHAIQAALKLLTTGNSPMFTAEVGTGKTTMALYVAAALSPEHHAETTRQLRDLGHHPRLPVVRKTLVLCPPHLLGSWRDQAAAVVPQARVQIVDDATDLDADADLFVLSRERAKLGHGHRGVADTCPRCAAPITTSARANASRRLRCQAQTRRPANLAARLSVDLATLLAPALPEDDLVASLAPSRLLDHFRDRGAAPLSLAALASLYDRLFEDLRSVLNDSTPLERLSTFYALFHLIETVAELLERPHEDLARRLEGLAGELSTSSYSNLLRQSARNLAGRGFSGTAESAEHKLVESIERLGEVASWHTSAPCGEPLFSAEPPRRVALARYILRNHRRSFDLVILDEAHEFNNSASAQAKAAHRLTGLPGVPTLVLTGSLMGGYASSLFANFHALSPAFRKEFSRDEQSEFVARYGYQKVRITERGSRDGGPRGQHTDREMANRRVIGEAPGIHPLFLMRYLLPTAIPVHKSDLEHALPPLTEEPVPLDSTGGSSRACELLAEYDRLQRELLARIRSDRHDPALAGRLFGALSELPSYLDRATDDLEPFELLYPESVGGSLVARGRAFPASWKTPKERWLLEELTRRIANGERVLLFLRHTGSRLPKRIFRLVESVAPGAVWLDTRKVPTVKREAWIDRHVNEPDAPVLIVNPNAVRTGLNNLVGFSTAIWYELDYSAATYRQAIGRLHRIGQLRPVTILIPYYTGTAQEIAFRLVAAKVGASLQVDGLDVRAALEAAGAGDGLPDGLDAALSLGRAIYRALT